MNDLTSHTRDQPFTEADIVSTLTNIRKSQFERAPLVHSLLVQQQLAQGRNLAAILRDVIQAHLDYLDEDQQGVIAEFFLKGKTIPQIAKQLGFSESTIFRKRTDALRRLTAGLVTGERQARLARTTHLEMRIQIPRADLFGVGEKKLHLLQTLTAPGSPWVIGIDGIGGIGKTALAAETFLDARVLMRFPELVWVSARQYDLNTISGMVTTTAPVALTFEDFVVEALDQLLGENAAGMTPAERPARLRYLLQTTPTLVVVDNLETVADQHELLPKLATLTNPSKVLVTSRHHLQEYPDVFAIKLDELSARDSLALMRHEMEKRNLAGLAARADDSLLPIYEVTGGHPLAIKLVIGQLTVFPIERVIEDLRRARGHKVDEFYKYIYWHAWNPLDEDARAVLIAMPVVAESGGSFEQIEHASGLSPARATDALQQLTRLNLVNVVRGAGDETHADRQRYSIHRLTETFLLQEVIEWENDV